MITNLIVSFFFRLLAMIISFAPTIEVPASILGGALEGISWVAVVNYYIPFDTFLVCLVAYFALWIICAVISAILKLL